MRLTALWTCCVMMIVASRPPASQKQPTVGEFRTLFERGLHLTKAIPILIHPDTFYKDMILGANYDYLRTLPDDAILPRGRIRDERLVLNKQAVVIQKSSDQGSGDTSSSNSSSSSCSSCGSHASDLLMCSRCKLASYCNATCQRAHWRTHKKTCKAS
eukprot:TRINITY_DN9971_c0_g2_i1.p1 TRINITY_DN9971_c0_g2~~TRINITY_DN9971_c0_g2_i1.p1  ORF type:complete len:158 (+),score=25.00 TRINITY_DN9971_c0_g2_i1:381-854(+)